MDEGEEVATDEGEEVVIQVRVPRAELELEL